MQDVLGFRPQMGLQQLAERLAVTPTQGLHDLLVLGHRLGPAVVREVGHVAVAADAEIVVAGLTPESAKAANIEVVTDAFPFRANGRAMTLEANTGFIRMVARADNHLLVGIQGVGVGISELSAAFSLAIEMGARLEDVAGTVFAHPTLSEGMLEAALKTLGQPIHI